MRLRARASLVAEQTGTGLLSRSPRCDSGRGDRNHLARWSMKYDRSPSNSRTGCKSPARHASLTRCSMSTKLAFQAGKPGASPGRVDVSSPGSVAPTAEQPALNRMVVSATLTGPIERRALRRPGAISRRNQLKPGPVRVRLPRAAFHSRSGRLTSNAAALRQRSWGCKSPLDHRPHADRPSTPENLRLANPPERAMGTGGTGIVVQARASTPIARPSRAHHSS